jgi:hypothetical protein
MATAAATLAPSPASPSTTLGNVLNAASDQIIFNNATSEVLAGTSAVDVTAAGTSLAKALDIAAADAAASQADGQISAHTGVIAWFQIGGNTYAATDELIKIVGTVSLGGESLSGHTLTL